MAHANIEWPHFARPLFLGAITAHDLTEVDTIEEYVETAVRWSSSVWQAWEQHHEAIAALAKRAGVVD